MKRQLFLLAAGLMSAGWAADRRIPADTVLYYPFDTPETAMESFGSDRSKLVADAGKVQFLPDGRNAGCLFFDGNATLALPGVPAALPTGDAPYTVAAWIRVDADCPPTGGWISYGDRPNGCGNSFRLDQMDRVHNYWNMRDLTADMPGVGDGAWHHVAGTWDGRTRRLYYDGQEVAADDRRPEIGRSLFMIGRTMHDRPFKGSVDEVLVAKRAFSEDEIASLGAGAGGVQPERRQLAVKAADAEKTGWTVSFTFDADGLDKGLRLFSIPGVMRAEFRFAGVSPVKRELDDRFGNYINFPTADGRCPVIEATIPGQSTIGVPLGALKRADGAHEVTIRRGADAHWFMTVDEGYDEDGLRAKEWSWPENARADVFSDRVKDLMVRTPAIPRPTLPDERPIERSIQFWTPDGHNAWVGDVVVGAYRDRFHIFYLLDRRHHASKGGTGGHCFAHLSSPDLAHWFEHPHAIVIDEWWQTIGTGTPFVYDGKFCLAYGLHTTRFMKAEETTESFLKEYFKEHGDTGVFDFGSIPGYPLGGAYAESEDGIHFRRVNKLIHSAQNPTVYNRPDGRLGFVNSYGGIHGMYVSDCNPWGWKLEDDKIPIGGDCPCAFEWNGHHYLIQGFTHMAYNPDGRPGHWTNWTQTGDDVYDGMCVPMVAPWKGGRRIIAGWIVHPRGWGGWLAVHELVQYPDGKLGSKWLDEIPAPGDVFTFEGRPGERFARRFRGPDCTLEFSVDAANGRAQYANVRPDGSVPRMNTNAERERAGSNEAMRRLNGPPGSADEYAIERIRGLDRPYKVRLCAYYDKKADVTLFDAEIAGQRTMICRRPGRFSLADDFLLVTPGGGHDGPHAGADIWPFQRTPGAPAAARYEAEDARLAGGAALKGPSLVQSDIAAQASDMKYVELGKHGAALEWKVRESGVDGVTLRFTMPDEPDGWKQANPQDETPQYRREDVFCGSLELRVNGRRRSVRQYGKTSDSIPLSSYWMWQYFVGDRPADEPGGHEVARFAFDEVHFAIEGEPLDKGDVLSLVNVDGKYPYGVDFVELEKIPAPIEKPVDALSVADFGTGREAIDKCFAACREQGKTMYFPAGVWEYWTKTGDNRWLLNGASNMKITGAGMWHTNLHFPGSKPFGGGVGGDRLAKGTEFCHMYLSSMLRSRFSQNAVYKGIMEAWGEGAKLHHLWIEHFECGFWLGDYQSPAKPTVKAHIHDCRVRNNLADGINFCQGTSDTLLENCSFRGNGDDGIAIWNNDACESQDCRGITIRNNTVENNWRAASIAVFGGDGHLIENNFIKDGFKGAGIRLNTDFPGHQFRNTKEIRFVGNTIVNCGTSWDCYGDQAQDRPSPRGAIDFQGEVKNIVFERTTIIGAHRAAIQMIVGNMENIRFKNLVVDTIGTDGGRKSRYTWAEDLGPGRVFHLLGEMKPVVEGLTVRNVSRDNLVNLQEKDKKCIVWVNDPVFKP